jgi:hypothetical protein
MTVKAIGDARVLFYANEGQRLGTESDAVSLVNDAFNEQATVVAVPTTRFDDMFFHLSTRIAGEFIQKVANYRIILAILGDISEHTKTSPALRDFVFESNRRDVVWFLPDADSLTARLEAARAI